MKMYVIVKKTLTAGLKCAQAIHAFRAFCGEYPHIDEYWYKESNNIVVLQDDDIETMADKLEELGYRLSRFHEPDLDNQLTAICVEPNAWKHLSNVPLAA
jgi:hypothetical protein